MIPIIHDDDDDDTLFLSVFCARFGRSIGMGALFFSGHDACSISARQMTLAEADDDDDDDDESVPARSSNTAPVTQHTR